MLKKDKKQSEQVRKKWTIEKISLWQNRITTIEGFFMPRNYQHISYIKIKY